jgi:hypothetical protein
VYKAGCNSEGKPVLALSPAPAGPVLENFTRGEGLGSEQLGNDFHFSLAPTVTAGFIGFYFDIRK